MNNNIKNNIAIEKIVTVFGTLYKIDTKKVTEKHINNIFLDNAYIIAYDGTINNEGEYIIVAPDNLSKSITIMHYIKQE